MAIATKLTWLTVNLDDRADLDALEEQECAEGVLRAKSAIAELQALGIINENGQRIRKDIPEDMRADSECDMSSF